MGRRIALLVPLVCVVLACSSGPQFNTIDTTGLSRKDATDAVVAAFMDLGWAVEQVNPEMGIVTTGWRDQLIGDSRYTARVTDEGITLRRFVRVGGREGDQGQAGAISDTDAVVQAVREMVAGAKPVETGE